MATTFLDYKIPIGLFKKTTKYLAAHIGARMWFREIMSWLGMQYFDCACLEDSLQTLTGAGAVSVETPYTNLITTGVNALTLADASEGKRKTIVMITDGGDGTLTPANPLGFSTVVFNSVGDSVDLLFINSKWVVIGSYGVVIA